MKRLVRSLLPDSVLNRILPVYSKVYKRLFLSNSSTIAIESFSGLEIAHRTGTVDRTVALDNFKDDIFFAGVPEYSPGDADTIIDVGAHIGAFSLLAATRVPRGRVYAIEACQETYNLLRINVALNKAENVDCDHIALSDRAGTCTLYHDHWTENWGHTIVSSASGNGETVPCETLESFVERKGISHCHFMKLNCEGAEFPIILGAPPTVLAKFGMLLVLYHCDLYTQGSEADLVEHLRRSGFTTEIRNRTEKRGWIIARNTATGS